jgi:hypothetical protein
MNENEIKNIIKSKVKSSIWNSSTGLINFGLSYDYNHNTLQIVFDPNLNIAGDYYHSIIKNTLQNEVASVNHTYRGLVNKEEMIEIICINRRLLDLFSAEIDKHNDLQKMSLMKNGQATIFGFEYSGTLNEINSMYVYYALKVFYDDSYSKIDNNNLFEI